MTYRTIFLALTIAVFAVGCGDDSTTPSNVPPKFSVTMLPANEVPPITNAEASGNGTATITFNLSKDAAGNITAATADFAVNLTGFPAGTTLTAAHIHPGAVGVNGPAQISLNLTPGAIILTNGAGVFNANGIALSATDAQAIMNTLANFYFNVHSTLNGGGFTRGQLNRTQ
jgi:hypothetical protein